jgi:hypothetical protein
MTKTNRYGFEKISKVVPETFEDQNGNTEFAILWIETADSIYQVSVNMGETLDGLADTFRKNGWTNDRCIHFASK